jgi:cobalt-zinc-cadmium efflux system outer membrane protein
MNCYRAPPAWLTFELRAATIACVLLVAESQALADPGDAIAESLPTDAVLTQLIAESLAARPELAQAKALARAELERVPQAGALPDPMLQLGVQNDSFTSWQIGKAETSWYSVMASQTLPWPGKRGLREDAAQLAAHEAEQNTSRARLSTEADVRRAYLGLMLARERLALLDRLELISQQSAMLSRTRYEAGTGAQSDVLRAQLELNRIKQRRWTLQAEADTVQQTLNRLRAHPLDEPIDTPSRLSELRLPPSLDDASAIEDALQRSPELAASRLRVGRAQRGIDLARKSYYPDLTVSAGVMPRGGPFPPMWLLTIGIPVPVFSGSKQDRAVVENEARSAAADSDIQATEQVLTLRTRQRSVALRVALETIALYRDGLLVQSEATAESTRSQYQVGTVTFASMLEANAGLVADQEGYLVALAQAQTLAIERAEVALTTVGFSGAAPTTPMQAPSSAKAGRDTAGPGM